MPVVVALLVVGIALVAYGLDGLLRARRTQAVDLAIARRIRQLEYDVAALRDRQSQ